MKKWFAAAVTVLGLSLTAPVIAAEKIMIAEPNWVNARLMAQVIKHVIIDKLGVEADTVPGTNPLIFKGMDRGEIWIGPSAWAGTNIRRVKMRDYGLENFFDTTTEEEEIAYATFGDAYRKDKPYLTICYEPHYVFKLYDLFKLEEPPYDEEKWHVIQPSEDPDWFSKSKAMTADATKKIHVGYSLSLTTRAPQVAKLLKNISIDTQTMSDWTHQVVINKSEPAVVAQEWIAANPERIDGWLGL